MSNEFRPGHPVLFWLAIVGLVFLAYSASVAWLNQNDCDDLYNGQKHWVVFPPGWECGPGGTQLTSD